MIKKDLTIVFNNSLPIREKGISPEDTAKIFGGCVGVWSACSTTADCCQGIYMKRECKFSAPYGKNVCLNVGYN
jgi:hypothetical protein